MTTIGEAKYVVSRGHISVEQRSFSTSELEVSDIDCMILFSSWEPRCLEIIRSRKISAETGVVFRFSNRGERGAGERHGRELSQWLGRVCKTVIDSDEIDSLNEHRTFSTIYRRVESIYREKNRKLSIMIDMSSCPKCYTLFLVAFCLYRGLCSRIKMFYSEGKYEMGKKAIPSIVGDNLVSQKSLLSYQYTEGGWRPITVPFLDGDFNPNRRRTVIASLGFEGGNSHKLLMQYDPDELIPILASPGFETEYTEMASQENQRLLASFGISEASVWKIHAGDVCGMFAKVVDDQIKRSKKRDVGFLCFGPKTHALGLALSALVLNYPIVVCRIPDRFLEKRTIPNGKCWTYDIRDSAVLADIF